MRIGYIMDPLSGVKAEKDTTYFLMLAAEKRGHEVFYVDTQSLEYSVDRVLARVKRVEVGEEIASPFKLLSDEKRNLRDFDVLFVRTDPPFDRRYFYMTLLLDLIGGETKVINRPSGLRNWNEKMASLFLHQLGPETLITSNLDSAKEFLKERGKAVLKPIDGHGGRGIHILKKAEELEKYWPQNSHKMVLQEFIKESVEGDKRILLWRGEPLGAILRVAAKPGQLNNLDQGGHAEAATLTDRDLEICRQLKPGLVEQGIDFVGIDMLGPALTEVNVTSPTGLQELCRFSGVDHHLRIIDDLGPL